MRTTGSIDTIHNPLWLTTNGRMFLDCKSEFVEIYPVITQFTGCINGLDIKIYRTIPLWRKAVRGLFGV